MDPTDLNDDFTPPGHTPPPGNLPDGEFYDIGPPPKDDSESGAAGDAPHDPASENTNAASSGEASATEGWHVAAAREASKLLDLIAEGEDENTFQTFDDSPRKRSELARILHGRIEDLAPELARLNDLGAGIFYMINRGDGKGRSSANVTGIRTLALDLDGAPLQPVLDCGVEPHAIVESSRGKWHAYFLVEGCDLEWFSSLQTALAVKFGGDRSVKDLARVLRVPGFAHRKGEPVQVRVHTINKLPPYNVKDLAELLGLAEIDIAIRADRQSKGGPSVDTETGEIVQKVTEGGRHAHLLKKLADLNWRGLPEEVIRFAVQAENLRVCEPPKDEAGVDAVVKDFLKRYAGQHGRDQAPAADVIPAEDIDQMVANNKARKDKEKPAAGGGGQGGGEADAPAGGACGDGAGEGTVEAGEAPGSGEGGQGGAAGDAPTTFRRLDFDALAINPPPKQSFWWDGYLPSGVVTLFGAHGGTGKSYTSIMLAVSIAIGRPLFGVPTRAGRVAIFSGEDPEAVVWPRLQKVCAEFGVSIADIKERLHVLDATDYDPTLYTDSGDRGRRGGATTAGYDRLAEYVKENQIDVLIVDNASDAYSANEIERAQVRAFMRSLMLIAKKSAGAVMLLAHVAKTTVRVGFAEGGEGYSGSTAWHNSARSRLFMSAGADGVLTLEHQKSNLGRKREPLRLVWPEGGLPALEGSGSAASRGSEGDQSRRDAILELIAEFTGRGEYISPKATSPSNAFKKLHKEKSFPRGMGKTELTQILREAERDGLLEREEYRTVERKRTERWRVVGSAPSAPTMRQPEDGADGAGGAPSAQTCAGGMGGSARTGDSAGDGAGNANPDDGERP